MGRLPPGARFLWAPPGVSLQSPTLALRGEGRRRITSLMRAAIRPILITFLTEAVRPVVLMVGSTGSAGERAGVHAW